MGQHPGAAADRRFRFELAAHPGSVARARRLSRSRLSGWAVCEDDCDTAELVVSELVTNAIVHAAGRRVVCELQDAGDLVRIAVCDEGCAPGEPHPSPRRPDEEHGRGLLLVAAVSRAWGAQDTGPGLLVWAEIARSAGRAENIAGAVPETRPDAGGPDVRNSPAVPAVPDGPNDRNGLGDRGGPDGRHEPDALGAGFGDGPRTAPPGRLREVRRDAGSPDVGNGPRADLGWSAKKPPNDGRGTGAEGFWGAGTVGNPQPPSARGGSQDRDPHRSGNPYRDGDPRQDRDPRRDQGPRQARDRDRESL
ncbi:ATP-binding protein [Streptomyces sp. NPDC021080]|uniref:ATP-binding protein n=1 Tax=Streptomyces sp. NPDC021080 TaxID=3365110 RepID=UPI0037BC8F11